MSAVFFCSEDRDKAVMAAGGSALAAVAAEFTKLRTRYFELNDKHRDLVLTMTGLQYELDVMIPDKKERQAELADANWDKVRALRSWCKRQMEERAASDRISRECAKLRAENLFQEHRMLEKLFPDVKEREAAVAAAGGCIVTAVSQSISAWSARDKKLEKLLAEGFMFPDPNERAKAVQAADFCMVTAISRQCKVLAKDEAESLLAYLQRENELEQYLQRDAEQAARKRKRA